MDHRMHPAKICLALGIACAALVLLLTGVSRAETPAGATVPGAKCAALADGEGRAALTAPTLHAGLTETFCLVYTATSPISTGGSIRVIDPDFNGMGWAMWQKFQDADAGTSGYLSADSTNLGVTLEISREQTSSVQDQSYTTVFVRNSPLRADDEVTLCFANGHTPHKAYKAVEWRTLTDSDGDGNYTQLGTSPRMDILPDPSPTLMIATGPTYVQAGVPFTLSVRVLDRYSNPCVAFADQLMFSSTDPLAVLPPATVPFPPGNGVYALQVTLNTTGIQYIHVDSAGPLPAVNSNPFVVVDALDAQPQIFWGDLHGHHGHIFTSTQGQRVDEYMEYARDVADLDFACESHKSSSYFNTIETHVEIETSVLQYNEPGQFVTIRGYEWMGKTGTQGHHNPYFSGPSAVSMIYSPDDPASDTLDELWQLLEENLPPGIEAITPPHALLRPDTGSGSNWHNITSQALNRRYRPLVEIYSHWGSSEDGEGSAREALIYGNRVGFYGSSDTHFAYPGNPQTEAWGPRGQDNVAGLAAVRADTLTREALWQGLTGRHTYATEGERIFLDFTVNGYGMGSAISTTVAPRAAVTAAGTTPISEALVFKGTYVTDIAHPGPTAGYYSIITSTTPGTLVASFEVTDTGFDADAFYYVRVTQSDGKQAWSSPIWVDYGTRIYLPAVMRVRRACTA